jgi:hypothetical protein
MMQRIQRLILDFTKDTGLTERREMVHGTLYVKLHEEKECDHFHKVLRTFFKEEIDNEGGVNMYAVGDEFAFDFVPEDREAPVFVEPYSEEKFSGKEIMDPTDIDKGIWSEFAEEEMFNNIDLTDEQESELDVLMNLEAESKRGK